jgi:phosphatidate cytidylyltransferase
MLRQRVVTAVIAAIVVLLALFVLPQEATRLIIAVLMLIAAWEWSGLLSTRSVMQRWVFVGLSLFLMAAIFFLVPHSNYSQWPFVVAVAWWILAFFWLLVHPTPIPIAVGWLSGQLVIVPAWYAIEWLYLRSSGSLLIVLLIVVVADVGAYFSGKQFGQVKLAPSISPGKTWEGVIGAMIAVAVLSIVIAFWTGASILVYLPLFLAIGVLSVVGDLTVSVFKRKAGVKDSGRLFPGHGGVLDRIDGITAATPVFALAASMGVLG